MKYQFTPDMNSISGMGDDYEQACRLMLDAALVWLDEHPDAEVDFAESKDTAAWEHAIMNKSGFDDASGAQMGAVKSSAKWIRMNGWDAYVRTMTHPQGQVGILEDKLSGAKADLKRANERIDNLLKEVRIRSSIIAERVLGWSKHLTDNNAQCAYGPSRQAVLDELYCGSDLLELVNREIVGLQTGLEPD